MDWFNVKNLVFSLVSGLKFEMFSLTIRLESKLGALKSTHRMTGGTGSSMDVKVQIFSKNY
jgi:hypothetical protein